MNTKAFVLVPKSEATTCFLGSFPHDVEIAVVPDEEFHDFLARYDESHRGEEIPHEPLSDEEDLLGDPHEAGC